MAGVAAVVWKMRPDLDAATLRTLLVTTGQGHDCLDSDSPTPVVDAYAAILATDTPTNGAPVRRAILGVRRRQRRRGAFTMTVTESTGQGICDASLAFATPAPAADPAGGGWA